MPDDGSLAAEQLSGREIVTKALELLRANYVFPEQAGQAAAAIEARLEAGEYDDLDEITLTERLTSDLQEITGDRHLRVVLGGGPGPRRERVPEPEGPKDHEAMRLAMRRRGAGQLRHPPGRAARRQRRLPGRAPGRRPGQRGPGHRRGHGTGRRDLRAHHRPAAEPRRRARGRGLLVQLPARRAAHPPQRHLPRRHRRDQAVLGAALRAGDPLPRPPGLRADQRPHVLRRRGLRLHAAGTRPGRGDRRDDRRRRAPDQAASRSAPRCTSGYRSRGRSTR